MSKKPKRSFVRKNFKSRFVKPAVYAVDENAPEDERKSDVVREAEEIIDAYLKKIGCDGISPRPRRRKSNAVFSICAALCAAFLIFLIARFL